MTNEHDSLAQRGRALEDSFFRDLDATLIERMRAEAQDEASRKQLANQAGITDPTLLAELGHQGVTIESLVALALVPMVLVAWADRGVSDDERASIVAEARKLGIHENSIADQLLASWLRIRPTKELSDAWKRYTHGLLATMAEASKRTYIDDVVKKMTAVAKASGGVLGFGTVSDLEATTIKQLTGVLHADD